LGSIIHEQLERDFWRLYEPEEKEQILSQSREAVLQNLTSDKDFWKVAKARYWCSKNALYFIPDLIKLLENPSVIGLQGYADLIIWERIVSKDLPFYGHGWVVPDDLFSIAGRASWITLHRVTTAFLCVLFLSLPPYGEAAYLYLAPGPSLIHMTFDRRALLAGIQ
jgi:hypothetical protein